MRSSLRYAPLAEDAKMETLDQLQAVVKEWIDKCPDEMTAPVTPESLEGIYFFAFRFYQQGHYRQAESTFRMLSRLNAFEPKYWIGLGAALQMQNKYSKAIETYCAARLLDDKNSNPEPSLQSAICYFAQDQRKEGLRALDVAEQSAKHNHDQQTLEHIALLKTVWSNEVNNKHK